MSQTSQPPRRELYLLEKQPPACDPQESAETEPPTEAAFLYPKPAARIRIGAGNNPQRAQIYNAEYLADGTRYTRFDKPWTAFTTIDFRTFKTHPEALDWVLQEARK